MLFVLDFVVVVAVKRFIFVVVVVQLQFETRQLADSLMAILP